MNKLSPKILFLAKMRISVSQRAKLEQTIINIKEFISFSLFLHISLSDSFKNRLYAYHILSGQITLRNI